MIGKECLVWNSKKQIENWDFLQAVMKYRRDAGFETD